MKRKFLLLVCAVLCILQANAYTTDNLVSDGWSLAPNFSSNKDYVYVLVDAGSSNYAVSRNISDINARPVYVTLPNPYTTPSIVWTFETRNNGLAMRNVESQYYFNGGARGWDATNKMASTYDNNASFTFTSIGDNKYSIQRATGTADPGMYLGPWNDGGSVDHSGEDVATNKKEGQHPDFYVYQMAKATYALKYLQNCPNLTAPVDVSFLIENPTIYQGGSNTSMPGGWDDWDCNTDYRTEGTGNTCLKGWKSSNTRVDYYQTLSNLPGGKYRLTAALRDNKNNGKFSAYVYQDPTRKVSDVATSTESDHTTAYLDVTTGTSINIGARTDGNSGNSTATADNFRLQVNPYLSTMATALSFPGSTSLTAGVWYYYDIPAEKSYDFTSSAAATIYYTQAADPLLDASTSSEAFTTGQTKDISLFAGRVYFKASEATTFSVAYRYNVGSATLSNADGSYTQSSTYSVTFPSAATNDPSASPALVASSKATVNGNEVALSAITNGFSLDLGSLAANTDYNIVIPADVYGYADESMNAAIDITLHTPAAFDGTYYLYNPYTEQFLGRGANYGTAAVVDKYGIPFNLTTDSEGYSVIQFADNELYLFNTYWLFADGASGDKFRIAPQTVGDYSGYGFYNKNLANNNRLYVYYNEGNGDHLRVAGNAVIGDNCTNEEQTVWQIKTVAEHNTIVNAYPTNNIQNVITASGISTTTDAFTTYLSNNFNEINITAQVGTATFGDNAGDWTWTEVRGETGYPKYTDAYARVYQATGTFSQTISAANLPAGIYKVKMAGFDRRAGSSKDEALASAYGSVCSSYLKVNGEQVRIQSWKAMFDAAGKEDNWAGQAASMNEGYADNIVYVYLDGSTDLTLTVAKPNHCADSYMCFGNFTLTRYDQTEVTMKTFKAGSYGTFIAPFDVTIPSGVTASKVTGHVGNLLTLEDLTTTIPKNTPVVVYSDDIINETFKGKDGSNGVTSYSKGLLTGIYTAADIAEGNYVLQTNGGVQGFYQVGVGGLTGVPYRAYLNSSALGVKAFFFGNDADAINDVRSKMEDGRSEIFNLAGQKMSKLQKGVNIVNGKKILVK